VSVTGEFLRSVGRCLETLEASDAAAGAAWRDRLQVARAIAARDLSTAAAQVLALDAGPQRISKLDLPTASETAEFRERCEHLLALTRVIAGVPNT
jgi:hypothetical protein